MLLALASLWLTAAPDAGTEPTCAAPWRSSTSRLAALASDDSRAMLCASHVMPRRPGAQPVSFDPDDFCVALAFDAGVFAHMPEWKAVEAASELRAADGGAEACVHGACARLELPSDKARSAFDFSEDGGQLVVALPEEQQVAVFETSSGRRLRTLKVAADRAYFLGDAILTTSEDDDAKAWLFVGNHRVPLKWRLDGGCTGLLPRVHLEGSVWALAEARTNRIGLVDVSTGAQKKVFSLGTLSWRFDGTQDVAPKGRSAALGVTACGTLPGARLVKTPNGRLVYVTSFGVALIDPKQGTVREFPFPACHDS